MIQRVSRTFLTIMVMMLLPWSFVDAQDSPSNPPYLGARDADAGELVSGVVVNINSCTNWFNDGGWVCELHNGVVIDGQSGYIAENIPLRGDFTAQSGIGHHYFQIEIVSVPDGYELLTEDFDLVGLCGGEYWAYGTAGTGEGSCTGQSAELLSWQETDPDSGEVYDISAPIWWINLRQIPTSISAVPAVATITDAVCVDGQVTAPSLQLPETLGVTYTFTGDVVAGGTITVVATPNEGYVLSEVESPYIFDDVSGTASYSVTFLNPDCAPVEAPSPTPTLTATSTEAPVVPTATSEPTAPTAPVDSESTSASATEAPSAGTTPSPASDVPVSQSTQTAAEPISTSAAVTGLPSTGSGEASGAPLVITIAGTMALLLMLVAPRRFKS